MAPITKTLALTGAFFAALSSALPLQKRDNSPVVWETVTNVVWTTVDVTTTVIPGQAPTVTSLPVPAETTKAAPAPAETTSATSAPPAPPAPTSESTSSTWAPAPTSQAPQPVVSVPSVSIPAPEPTIISTTSVAPAPEPTSSTSTSTTTSSTAAPVATTPATNTLSTSSGSSSGPCSAGSPCSGDGTYYDTATTMTNPSACGTANDGNTENVLALAHGIMTDSDCGRTITIKYGGKTATGTIVDKCMGCEGDSIDLSRHLFSELADESAGRLYGVEWYFNN